jgi:hypothetical protein
MWGTHDVFLVGPVISHPWCGGSMHSPYSAACIHHAPSIHLHCIQEVREVMSSVPHRKLALDAECVTTW